MRMLSAIAAISTLAATAAGQSPPWVQQGSLEILTPSPGQIEVRCLAVNPTTSSASLPFSARIATLDGVTLLQGAAKVTVNPGSNTCSVTLRGDVPKEKAPLCMVLYELGDKEKGGRPMVEAMPQLEVRVLGYGSLMAGSLADVRIAALNHANGLPIPSAKAVLTMDINGARTKLTEASTGPDGGLNAQFAVPSTGTGSGSLIITVSADGFGQDEVSMPISIQRKSRILLTTDKPLYQPGQTIQMRALSMNAADMKPEADKALTFEVMDAKGNKVFKESPGTDAFGVSSAKFVLASEVNQGPYIVRAILEETTTEKQVTVERYVLPKFKAEVTTDKEYYLPGEMVKGKVQADYFFGKPVALAKVKLTASKYEVNFEDFATQEGKLDEQGAWSFELPLPRQFIGTPIEQGGASVRLSVEVIDTAEHLEEKVVMKPIAQAPIIIHAVSEGALLAKGLENRVFLMAAYPDGSPVVGAEVTNSTAEVVTAKSDIKTDALGVAVLTVLPNKDEGVLLKTRVRDAQGHEASSETTLSTNAGQADALILRTAKTLYEAGERLEADVYATKKTGMVYFDLVREGQTVMTRVAELAAGKAHMTLDLDAALTGSLVLHAYMFTPTTDMVRDTRLLYVNPAGALSIAVALDKETYKPGEKAKLGFTITDKAGAPSAAAIGVAIVDESVFALQEIHPGLEKIYFTLEQEIMKPRYEIHGFELPTLIKDQPVVMEGGLKPLRWSDDQQRAAEVLLASAEAPAFMPVQLNSFDTKTQAIQNAISERLQADYQRIVNAVQQYMEKSQGDAEDILKALLRKKLLRPNELVDPWGNRYEFDFTSMRQSGWFTMTSNGPDGVKGTPDDIQPGGFPGAIAFGDGGGMMGGMGMAEGAVRRGGMVKNMAKGENRLMEQEMMADMAIPPAAMPAPEMAAPMMLGAEATTGPAPAAPRIREYFPETLLFEPALIADGQGKASLELDIADSITTWRMTSMASSQSGALGSQESPIRVFQDFFVDLDLPVSLTQGDKLSIPVVVYNYLTEAQDVKLKFEEAPWFKLGCPAEQTLNMASGEVKSIYFPIEAVQLGAQKLTVWAYGSKMSDAIRREIEVEPNGKRMEVSFSDRLTKTAEHKVEIPAEAVAGASKILVRVYPGVFSQIVDGLDSLLRMPSGCFEQTSSITYPNILIVQYLRATKAINPELQMTAEGYINSGYQRLLAYEVQGGGFSWFGDAPANKVLTAWGVKEFADMAKVHEVDPAIIERTKAWLISQQQEDGSWKPDENYLHQESWSGIQGSQTLVTAYIADALLMAGGVDQQVARAVEYIRRNWKADSDSYTTAIVANAATSWKPADAFTRQVLETLWQARVEEGETVHWKGGKATVTFSHGESADVETTALAAMALMRGGVHAETVGKALTWLIQKKQPSGDWGGTQATILSLQALMQALGNQTEKVSARVKVTLNNAVVGELDITPETSDVMRLLDLKDKTNAGSNTVTLEFTGEGSMLYQVVGRYYAPWGAAPPQLDAPMAVTVAYDKTQLAVNDTVRATVTVQNKRPEAAQMVVVDVGIPPGFQVSTPDLDKLVADKTIQKYEMTGRQIMIYFDKIDGNATKTLGYELRARFPIKAQTPRSTAYQYYNPEANGVAKPEMITVE